MVHICLTSLRSIEGPFYWAKLVHVHRYPHFFFSLNFIRHPREKTGPLVSVLPSKSVEGDSLMVIRVFFDTANSALVETNKHNETYN